MRIVNIYRLSRMVIFFVFFLIPILWGTLLIFSAVVVCF